MSYQTPTLTFSGDVMADSDAFATVLGALEGFTFTFTTRAGEEFVAMVHGSVFDSFELTYQMVFTRFSAGVWADEVEMHPIDDIVRGVYA